MENVLSSNDPKTVFNAFHEIYHKNSLSKEQKQSLLNSMLDFMYTQYLNAQTNDQKYPILNWLGDLNRYQSNHLAALFHYQLAVERNRALAVAYVKMGLTYSFMNNEMGFIYSIYYTLHAYGRLEEKKLVTDNLKQICIRFDKENVSELEKCLNKCFMISFLGFKSSSEFKVSCLQLFRLFPQVSQKQISMILLVLLKMIHSPQKRSVPIRLWCLLLLFSALNVAFQYKELLPKICLILQALTLDDFEALKVPHEAEWKEIMSTFLQKLQKEDIMEFKFEFIKVSDKDWSTLPRFQAIAPQEQPIQSFLTFLKSIEWVLESGDHLYLNTEENKTVLRKEKTKLLSQMYFENQVQELSQKVQKLKILVLDTESLLHLPFKRFNSKEYILHIPLCVLRQLDILKSSSFYAREVMRFIDEHKNLIVHIQDAEIEVHPQLMEANLTDDQKDFLTYCLSLANMNLSVVTQDLILNHYLKYFEIPLLTSENILNK